MSDATFVILAADMVASSRLMAESEEDVVIRLADLNVSIAEIVERNDGRLFVVAGDGFKASFAGAVEGLTAAWDIQKLVRARNGGLPLSRQMQYRIGIAGGPAQERNGELFGTSVAVAAGLEPLAPPGGVVLSQDIYDAVVNERLFKFDALGEQKLRGVKGDVAVYALLQPGQSRLETPTAPSATTASTRATTEPTQGKRDWSELRRASLLLGAAGLGVIGLFYAFNGVVPAPKSGAVPPVNTSAEVRSPPPPQPISPPVVDKQNAPPPLAPSLNDTPVQPQPANGSPPAVALAPPINTTAPPPPPPARPVADPLVLSHMEDCFGATADTALLACRSLLEMSDLGPFKGREGEIQGRLGRLLREAGRLDEAITNLDAAMRSAPSATVAGQIGIAHFTRGRLAEAEAAFSEAIRLDPRDGEAFNNRAWTRLKRDQAQTAQADAREAQRLSPDQSYVWDTSGHIEERLGNKQSAIEHFRRALSLEPGKPSSAAGLKRLGEMP